MNWSRPRALRGRQALAGLTAAAAFGLVLAAPVSAAAGISATFDPATGTLSVAGDEASNAITIGRNAAGAILVNGGMVKTKGKASAVATVANTALIHVLGQGGDDQLALDEANGPLPKASLDGGAGNDTLIGGSGVDLLTGGAGNDALLGKAGVDTLRGGDGDDTLTGGDGDDQAFGEAGDDRLIWNPGDDTDLDEGGDGADAVEVNGGGEAETFSVTANGTRVRFDRHTPAPFALDIGTVETLVLNASGGDDSFSAVGNLAALIKLTVDGGAGNDTILGGNGVDLLLGGDGNDVVDGQQGNDLLVGGPGDDLFQWDPGDGSDTVEGQAGQDGLRFNGSGANETIALSANGQRARLTRDIATIVMDLDDVERIDLRALGGADAITVNDLAGTDVTTVVLDLAAVGGGGDGQADAVVVNGTSGDDTLMVAGGAGGVTVSRLTTAVTVSAPEAALDALRINGLAGNDLLKPSGPAAGGLVPVFDGGDGDDAVEVNGGNDAETFAVAANGAMARLDRLAPAPISLDIIAEQLTVNAGGGDDTFSAVGNLAALIKLTVDGGAGNDTLLGGNGADLLLGGDGADVVDGQQGNDAAFLGAGDDAFQWDPGDGSDTIEGQDGQDTLRFNGSGANEAVALSANGPRARLTRDVAGIVLDMDDIETVAFNALGGADTITVNDLAGADVKTVALNLAGTLGGGAGDGLVDAVVVNGTIGNDSLTVTGNAGVATVAGLAATVSISSPEGTLDTLRINGLAGDDALNPSGLAAGVLLTTFDGGDGADSVEVNGGDAAETFAATANGAMARLDRLAPAPISLDIIAEQLTVNAGGSDDAFSATGNLAALIKLTVNGGAGNDTLLGGNGVDAIDGGDGNDVVDGQQGNDLLVGGPGDDLFQWDPGDGSDTVEGQAGQDGLRFNGSGANETIALSANGQRARLTRDIATIVMDLDDVERIDLRALGGADAITVNDLAGTDVTTVVLDLAAVGGGGDAQVDAVIVNATGGNDAVTIAGGAGQATVSGLAATVSVGGAEGGLDTLRVNGLAGDDALDASGLAAGVLALTLDGGDGVDTLTGSAGTDVGLNGEVLIGIP